MTRFLHSSSAQKYFEKCPQQFWLYQSGAPKGETPEHFRFGLAAHLVMQDYVDWCVAQRRRTDITKIGEFIDAAVRKTHLPLSRYDELTAVIRGYLAVYEVDVEHSVEREAGIAFDNELRVVPWSSDYDYDRMRNPMAIAARGIMIRLRLDENLLFPEERRLVVRDFKSDLFLPSQSMIEDPSSRFNQQARKYAWAAWRAIFPADVVEVEFPFMRYCAHGSAATRRLMFGKDDILEIEEQELAKIQFLEATQDFPARPGDHCASCVYRKTACPVPNEDLTDDPASLARRFLYQKVEQDELRDRIKEHAALHGWDGEIGALHSSFEQSEGNVPDMERVWHELQDVGFEAPWKALTLSKTAAKDILPKDVYERVLETAYDPTIEVRFNLHQNKDVLQKLALERGISLQIPKKDGKGMKDKTVAQLALELANCDAGAGGERAPNASEEPVAVDLSTVTDTPSPRAATSFSFEPLEEIR